MFFTVVACNNEVKLNDDWKETTIIYGMINISDTNTYLRVSKAFLGEGNAYDYAKIADSSEYNPDDISVTMEEWRNGSLQEVFSFEPFYTTEKDSGYFFSPNQIIYKANTLGQLDINSNYKVVVINKTGDTVTSSLSVVDTNLRVSQPFSNTSALPTMYKALHFPTKVSWGSVKNGYYYDVKVSLNVLEILQNGDSVLRNIPRGKLASKYYTHTDGTQEVFEFEDSPDAFLNFLAGNTVHTDSEREADVNYRKLGSYVLEFDIAGYDFQEYVNSIYSQSISQDVIVYSNINNGRGLVSSRAKKYYPCQISEILKNVIYEGDEYRYLKFKSE